MKALKLFVVILVLAFFTTAGVATAGTLAEVQARGDLIAGVNGAVFGFSMPDKKGVWKGIDVDTARAIAAAVFGDAKQGEIYCLDGRAAFARSSVKRD